MASGEAYGNEHTAVAGETKLIALTNNVDERNGCLRVMNKIAYVSRYALEVPYLWLTFPH